LLAHHWPGNVRELRNVIERALILETTKEIQPSSLPDFQIEARLPKSPTLHPRPVNRWTTRSRASRGS
jgi:transcriptional regulator with PAS, ATPase and Fis domain